MVDYYSNFRKISAKFGDYYAEIIMDIPEVGSYLYIYLNGICEFDYLQDSFEICKEQAFEEFGIPLDAWVEVTKE